MSLLKVNEVQNYNGSSLTLTASTVSTSAQLNTGGNISVTGSINVSDDSTTRSNLGLGSIATQDSNNVTITGGNISIATLGSSVISDDYGYAQVKLTGDVGTQGFITFNTVVGDSNFVISSELITLPYSGIYHIVFSGTGFISGNTPERTFSIGLYTGATGLLATARDQISYLDSSTSFGNACLSYVGSFSASDTIKFNFSSDSGASVDLQSTSHASLVLVRRTV